MRGGEADLVADWGGIFSSQPWATNRQALRNPRLHQIETLIAAEQKKPPGTS